VRNYDSLLANQERAAQKLKRDSVEFASLRSEVTKKRETLNSLLSRQNEMALSSRLVDVDSSTNIRVMERARVPAAPFKPRTRFNILVGLVFGLGLGVGVALLLDYLDNTINSDDDLQRILDLPILAIIPRYGDKSAVRKRGRHKQVVVPVQPFDTVSNQDSQSAAAEGFRELRTAILLSNPGTPPKTIMITSANPEEGKTSTAVNLSIVLAQMGRRVALVDTDLRRPRLHHVFSADNTRGVSNHLSGLEPDSAVLLQSTPIQHLSLLPSGPIPPNPSELLNSSIFAEMGKDLLSKGYDHVVFDSPPTVSVSDPVIIASVVDSGILVVRAGKTERQSVKLAADKLTKSKIGHLGLVLSDVSAETLGSRYYYYHQDAGGRDSTETPQGPGGHAGGATA
jgi:capsular exopolysaccharide synthesis family protein